MPLSPFVLLDNWRAPPPRDTKVAWLAGATYAHRGLHKSGVPENSSSAFAAAIARGLGIECDVQRSYDGQAMVFHDAGLERLTGETGLVAELTSEDLGKIVLTGGNDTIPTLRQVLDQVGGQVPVIIEIKSKRKSHQRTASLCLAVRRVLEGYTGPHAIMSFDPRIVRWFANRSSLTVRGLVMTEENDRTLLGRARRRLAVWHARPDFLAYDIRDLPSAFAASQRSRGLPLLTWTVRSQELAQRAARHADAPIAEGDGLT